MGAVGIDGLFDLPADSGQAIVVAGSQIAIEPQIEVGFDNVTDAVLAGEFFDADELDDLAAEIAGSDDLRELSLNDLLFGDEEDDQ